MLMLPEIIIVATAIAVLLIDLLLSEQRRVLLAPFALAGIGAALLALILGVQMNGQILGGQFAIDAAAWWFKIIFLVSGFITVILSMDLLDGRAAVRVRGLGFRGEYYALLLFTLSGMMYLVSARDVITLYVSLELAAIPLFAMVAWRRDHVQSGEAAMKYILTGAMASAFTLYGLSLLYGLSGTMDLAQIAASLLPSPVFWLAAALVLTGVGFKLTLVPFHMWAADVYEGAPTPVTAYLSVASKAAGLAFLFQMFFRTLGPTTGQWTFLMAVLAAVTMTLGNLVAIVQKNIKRFMAFSAISQAGYLIMGFVSPLVAGRPSGDGVPAMMFYMLVYITTNLGVFTCIVWYSNQTGRADIDDYRGLSRTNPLMALAMMLALFSLAGIPPLSGFVGKFFLFKIASGAGYHWLVAVAAVNSTISLYYYLGVVRRMYIEPPLDGAQHLPVSKKLGLTSLVLTLAVVLLGIIPFFYETIQLHLSGWLAALGR